MVKKLKDLGADVMQIGQHWYEADTYLREVLLGNDEDGVYVHPFDHEDIWKGHASIVEELEVQMLPNGGYDALVCSVGGGGMFCGIMEGLHNNGRLKGGKGRAVKVLAMETKGADCMSNVSSDLAQSPRSRALISALLLQRECSALGTPIRSVC
jgi:L-serine/L-threonine ammonia-lyase